MSFISNSSLNAVLFGADDLVLIAETKLGLQRNLDIPDVFSAEWKMKANIEKTKVLIFNKSRRLLGNEHLYFKVIHFSTLMSSQSSTWKVTTQIKLNIT